MDFYTSNHSFRQMDQFEINQLEEGDEIAICINNNPPDKMEFITATVIRPMFWNSDADEPNWEVETTNGFVDAFSIYEVKER